MNGVPVATQYSLEFVLRSLPDGARDVLEVGCGSGELAAALQKRGCNILALDSDADAIAGAKARGVKAQLGTWPLAVDRAFDAVLFTRSLHHIHDLDGAVEAAMAALKPHGRVIVEDFRSEGGSARSSAWFKGLVKLLHAAGAFQAEFELEHTLSKMDTVDHEHPLHSSSAIADALVRRGAVQAEDSACYFRYLEPDLRDEAAATRLLEHELELISGNAIDALGKRFVLMA